MAQAAKSAPRAMPARAPAWSSIPPTISLRRPPRSDLGDAPDRRVDRHQQPDLAERQAGTGEEEREDAPGQAIVEVVDEAGLARRRERWIAECARGDDAPQAGAGVVRVGGRRGRLVRHVAGRLAHQPGRDAEPQGGPRAVAAPKATRKASPAVAAVTPNSSTAMSGSSVRSWPTVAPTRPLTATSSANWGRLARRPSRITGTPLSSGGWSGEERGGGRQDPDHDAAPVGDLHERPGRLAGEGAERDRGGDTGDDQEEERQDQDGVGPAAPACRQAHEGPDPDGPDREVEAHGGHGRRDVRLGHEVRIDEGPVEERPPEEGEGGGRREGDRRARRSKRGHDPYLLGASGSPRRPAQRRRSSSGRCRSPRY